ncbi:hypothetical protein SP15_210 [Bacillus phage SP-15]|uniref:Uncharacterized protein n=1 Tax=Bacillus phage SP-15 TaxID=1792032 RepID=A0A127AWM8_9CAUD|nr:hypothetical protein SP15_210 [Bacillus phage SP-15]AMM45010.1 hypothetical protein SP15_210 [Bacillus phage SP-15]
MNKLATKLFDIVNNDRESSLIVEEFYLYSDEWEPYDIQVFRLTGTNAPGERILKYNPYVVNEVKWWGTDEELAKLVLIVDKFGQGEYTYEQFKKSTAMKQDPVIAAHSWIANVKSKLSLNK